MHSFSKAARSIWRKTFATIASESLNRCFAEREKRIFVAAFALERSDVSHRNVRESDSWRRKRDYRLSDASLARDSGRSGCERLERGCEKPARQHFSPDSEKPKSDRPRPMIAGDRSRAPIAAERLARRPGGGPPISEKQRLESSQGYEFIESFCGGL